MAEAHLEVYRRFQGELRAHPLRFWPILASGVRTALKGKLALILLYAPLVIGTVLFSFFVYAKFAGEQMLEQLPLEEGDLTEFARQQALALARQGMQLLEVRNLIALFQLATVLFSLLATAWYGSGLFCEDRRAGAHQLYFARPITRSDYFLGKFLVLAFFTALTTLAPALVICLVATFSSPDWSFLKEEGDVIWRTTIAAAVWIALTGSATLAISSLTRRKVFALIGCIALIVILEVTGGLLADLASDRLRAFAPLVSYHNAATWILGVELPDGPQVELRDAWIVLGALTGAALATIALRLRRLEVVA